MSLVTEMFPKLSGGETFIERAHPGAAIGEATKVVTSPAVKIWDNLNYRNPQTGAPEGSVAIMKERMLRFLLLRTKKIARPYRRMRFA